MGKYVKIKDRKYKWVFFIDPTEDTLQLVQFENNIPISKIYSILFEQFWVEEDEELKNFIMKYAKIYLNNPDKEYIHTRIQHDFHECRAHILTCKGLEYYIKDTVDYVKDLEFKL